MKINKVIVGDLETNCYILSIDNKCIIIDPGDEIGKIKKEIGDKEVIAIIITHYHFDHIGALDNFDKNLILDRYNLEEKEYCIGNFKFNIIYTPGHKEDSISIYFKEDKIMFTGDFLFKDTVGRCDLVGGNIHDMIESINKIKEYKGVLVYPGHGEYTNIDDEIKYNIYFKDSSIL